ncbi:MAG: alanine--glyoxylate aminotransferase family protein [Deltaproteobacteria bacterium]|nr:alanine--glyoxylate aminotransferase family protein [Deltaproteobacteria bacterium]
MCGSLDFSPRILMGPGPSNVDARVLQAMALPSIGHLDPQFINIMERIKTMLREVMLTGNELTISVSGTGSAGMEAAQCNLIEPGDRCVVCVNGVFGGRSAAGPRPSPPPHLLLAGQPPPPQSAALRPPRTPAALRGGGSAALHPVTSPSSFVTRPGGNRHKPPKRRSPPSPSRNPPMTPYPRPSASRYYVN